jgi:hypothetical protein
MKTILDLFLVSDSTEKVPDHLTRFAGLARERELEFRRVVLPRKKDGSFEMQDLLDQVLQAQGFWINNPHMLSDPQILQAVETRLKEGAVAIAQLSASQNPRPGDEFFQDMGLLATSIRAVAPRSSPNLYGHPMLVVADRQNNEAGFRDPVLFQSVNRLLLQQANGIHCEGGAQTVLALPIGAIQSVDMERDEIVQVARPELPVIASTARPQWLGGRVIAMHAGIVQDAHLGPTGIRFPGIEGEDNAFFARNLLQIVAGTPGPQLSWEAARSVAIQFETAIANLIRLILADAYGDEWFARAAPEKVRSKCNDAWVKNNRAATPQSHLNLIQFIELFEENWSVIGSALAAAGQTITLREAKAAISQVNPIRNLAMHVTKAVYGDKPTPTPDEMTVLRKHANMMVAVERAVQVSRRLASTVNRLSAPR